jgi:hypothetical protein
VNVKTAAALILDILLPQKQRVGMGVAGCEEQSSQRGEVGQKGTREGLGKEQGQKGEVSDGEHATELEQTCSQVTTQDVQVLPGRQRVVGLPEWALGLGPEPAVVCGRLKVRHLLEHWMAYCWHAIFSRCSIITITTPKTMKMACPGLTFLGVCREPSCPPIVSAWRMV